MKRNLQLDIRARALPSFLFKKGLGTETRPKTQLLMYIFLLIKIYVYGCMFYFIGNLQACLVAYSGK